MSAETSRPPRIFAAILILLSLPYLYGGIALASVSGSFYYALAGLALAASAALLWKGDKRGAHLYGALVAATVIWALWEVGTNLWALMPRVSMLAFLGLWFLTPFVRRGLYSPQSPPPLLDSPIAKGFAAVTALTLVGVVALSQRSELNPIPERMHRASAAATSADTEGALKGEWHGYGNTTHGTRYARLDQITPANVNKLEKIWEVRTGQKGWFKVTPVQAGDLVYVCTAFNVVQALDAESGAMRWQFDSESKAGNRGFSQNCRGVSYYKAPVAYTGSCPERIVMGTTDARLFALNAKTGERCADFGNNGEISLLPGMGDVKAGFYYVTSPPTIARGLAIVGGWVLDNAEVNEPSGVIRAFDAVTGKFAWAWDMGRPDSNTEPAEGEHYTRGTPNMWSMTSYDDELGLIYAPLGNATPDYVGTHRTAEMEKYSSSVVALDVTNGKVRWHFQTVHHDIWDYDVPSQPALVDLPQADGTVIPALVQGTKRAELFVLDRRDGKPIAPVEERPVPQGAVPEDYTSKTQPFSVGMPHFRDDWTEATMWGITPFDQMWCRYQFKTHRYEGHFTPPSVQGTVQFPGNAGGFNWGSLAIDEDKQLLVVNPLIMANILQLHPRASIKRGMRVSGQTGTPYGASTAPFLSPLDVPCQQPPYARLAVIDLQTRELLWSRGLGATNEIGPLGMRFGIPLPMGVPIAAGSLVTKGGLIFIGGTRDKTLRAVDVSTGEVKWQDRLPAQAEATAMSYLSPNKRQIVLIAATNTPRTWGASQQRAIAARPEDPQGGYLIAYALPAETRAVTK
ncbi:MAG TPA: membrane-bound PQQ-dependent dehydrogenase, glucose/quinate/shikimate family [Steroidobacteraceae bacterium]|nr:membrane-bound PQQ-dependent dehydrogenase, glucose/quinate/shikimate family [Steroidobacteraceae bacterium]